MKALSMAISPLAVAALTLACSVGASEPISGRLTANPVGEVSIVVTRGSVTVIGVEGEEVAVDGTRDHQSEAFIFERSGDVVQIEDRLPEHTSSGPGTQITVHVPRGSRLRAQLVSADVDASAVRGAVRVGTVSGRVTARELGEAVEISAVSSDLMVDGATGDVRLDTVSGDIEARLAATRITAKTVSGSVEIENNQALARGRMGSTSGDLELSTSVAPDVELEVETVSGDATLTLGGDLDLRLDMIGGPSGAIRNRLDDTPVQEDGRGDGERLETRFGAGHGYVRAATVSGTLTVARP